MRTKKDFLDWLYGCKIYHGTTRYGQFNGHHVFASSYGENDELRDMLNNLEGDDNTGINAGNALNDWWIKDDIWLAYGDDPRIAMNELIDEIENYYFNVLNKDNI